MTHDMGIVDSRESKTISQDTVKHENVIKDNILRNGLKVTTNQPISLHSIFRDKPGKTKIM